MLKRYIYAFFGFLFTILLILVMATPARAADVLAVTTVGELNCNRNIYTNGLVVGGVKMDWSVRSKRMATFLKEDVRASMYVLVECSPAMAKDLDALMGDGWTVKGFADYVNNGFLYNYTKLSLSNVKNVSYQDTTQMRAFTSATMTHDATGRSISIGAVHTASGSPANRDAQTAETLQMVGAKPFILAGDINASSPATTDCTSQAPRTQIACAGFDALPFGPTFNDYSPDAPTLELDYIGENSDSVSLASARNIATYPDRVSDHNATKVTVTF